MSKKNEEETKAVMIHDLNVSLYRKVKMICVGKGITIREGVEEALKLFLEANKD